MYELEGKAKLTRKHLVLRLPSAKGKIGNWDYFYRANEESILSDDTLERESLRVITIDQTKITCLPLRTQKNKKTYSKISRSFFGGLEGNIEGTLISPVEGELPGSLSWALYNSLTPRQNTPTGRVLGRTTGTNTNIRRTTGADILNRAANINRSPTPHNSTPTNTRQGMETQNISPLTVAMPPGGHEDQPPPHTPINTQNTSPLTIALSPGGHEDLPTPHNTQHTPSSHEEPAPLVPMTTTAVEQATETTDTHNTPTNTPIRDSHNSTTDTLTILTSLAEQADISVTQPLTLSDLIPPFDIPAEKILDDRCVRMGKLLAEIENVVAAKKRHINELADNRPPIIPLAKPFQCPSMQKVATKDLLDKLNAAMMSCAKECSLALIRAEEEVEKQLREEINELWEGWNLSQDELFSIKYIKESRLSRIHPYKTRTDIITFFEITGKGDGTRITPHVSSIKANTSGHKIPGNKKGGIGKEPQREIKSTDKHIKNATRTKPKNRGNKQGNKPGEDQQKTGGGQQKTPGVQQKTTKPPGGHQQKQKTGRGRNGKQKKKTNNTKGQGTHKTTGDIDMRTQIGQNNQNPPIVTITSPQAHTSRQTVQPPTATAQVTVHPPTNQQNTRREPPLARQQTRINTQEHPKNDHRYVAPHLRNHGHNYSKPPPTRIAPSYPPPARFRWTANGWETIQQSGQTGRNDRWTGPAGRYQPLRFVPSEGPDQNREGGRNCFRK